MELNWQFLCSGEGKTHLAVAFSPQRKQENKPIFKNYSFLLNERVREWPQWQLGDGKAQRENADIE